ncbi:MAG: hypothetical protein GY853_09255 [PVC group bacterium]|nr:hypothetical protein [PVC group bacterium]
MTKGFIAKLSKREKTVLYLSVLFVLFAVMDRAVIGPIFHKMQSLEIDIKNTQEEIKKNTRIIAQKKRIKAEEKEYASFSVEAGSEEEETAALLKELETMSSEFNVYLADMKPLSVEAEGGVKKFLVSINCTADMEALVSFLYAIESADKLFQLSAFSITPKSRQSSTAQCELLISKIVIP